MPLHHVVSYVATNNSWFNFRSEWRKVLATKRLDHFHMTDFEFAQRRLKHGQEIPTNHLFANWKLEDFDPFYKELTDLMNQKGKNKFRLGSFGSAIITPFFDILRPTVLNDDVRCKSYYIFNVYVLMHGIANWADANNYYDPIYYVFANGDREGNRLENMFKFMTKRDDLRRKFRLQRGYMKCFGLQWMKDEPAIQAVDIAAYESAKNINNWFELGCPEHVSKEKSRKRLNVLVKNLELDGWLYREQELKAEFSQMIDDVWKL